MAKTLKVKDIMLSLSEYAVVPRTATLREALLALDEAQKRVPEGRQPHRAVLVRDERGEIVGHLGHLAFLCALLPEHDVFLDQRALERAGVSDDMRSISAGIFGFLGDDLLDVVARVSNVPVADACWPATASIDQDASWYEAIKAFVKLQALSLLVRRKGRTIGILRLSDLFDELARQVKQNDSGTARK